MIITNNFNNQVKHSSDINEHLEALRDLSSQCNHITEMGVRYLVSTWAFLEGLPTGGTLISIDYKHPSFYNGDITNVEKGANEKGIHFGFFEADTLLVDIQPTDMLFLDTDHTYRQVKGELARHADKVNKYIAFHDTTSCENEIWPAIQEFIDEHKEWKILKRYTHNNGVTIIEKYDNNTIL